MRRVPPLIEQAGQIPLADRTSPHWLHKGTGLSAFSKEIAGRLVTGAGLAGATGAVFAGLAPGVAPEAVIRSGLGLGGGDTAGFTSAGRFSGSIVKVCGAGVLWGLATVGTGCDGWPGAAWGADWGADSVVLTIEVLARFPLETSSASTWIRPCSS